MGAKNLFIKRSIVYLLIISLLISFAGVSTFASTTIDKIKLRTNKFFNEYIDSWASERTISSIKKITDFSGNPYLVIECSPTGYLIYNEDAGVIMEESESSPSPYLDISHGLYGGPTQYYSQDINANIVKHTITGNPLSSNQISALSNSSKNAQEMLNNQYANNEVLNYINKGIQNKEVSIIPAAVTNSYISYGKTFFGNLNTSTKMGYYSVGDGLCGYVAAAMVLLYYDKYLDGNFIVNSTYLNSSGNAFKSNAFTKMLYNDIGKQTLGYSTTLNGSKVANVMKTYLDDKRNIDVTCWSAITVNIPSIRYQLTNRDIPVVYVNRFDDPRGSGTTDHCIVVYGYDNSDGLIAHFGWVGYEHVKCTSPALALFVSSACAITYY